MPRVSSHAILKSDNCHSFLQCFFDVPSRLAAKFMKISFTHLKSVNKKVLKMEWPFSKIRAGRSHITPHSISEHRDAFLKRIEDEEVRTMLEQAREYANIHFEKKKEATVLTVEDVKLTEPLNLSEFSEFPSFEDVAFMFD